MDLVPGAAGEVRDLDRGVAVLHRDLAELGETAPFGHIIDIHIERKAVPEAVDQTVVHNEIHSAVTADLLCESLKLRGKDRVTVFLKQLVQLFSRIDNLTAKILEVSGSAFSGVLTEANLLDRILANITVTADNLVHTAIRTRGHHIVFHKDGLAFLRGDHRHRDITVLEIIAFLPALGLYVLRTVDGLGLHRDKSLETVTSVDVHNLADRTQSVRRIDISLVGLVEIKPPVSPVGVPERIQIVMIGSFSVENLAETFQTVWGRWQGRQREAA